MRGKLVSRHAVDADVRIIPAHAGQTEQKALPHIFATDHPRACGANTIAFGEFFVGSGSSPRMRGKQVPHDMPCRALRIIPAHAGQTLPRGPRIRPWSDHPRACGANWVLGQHVNVAPGSSPRMRGKPMTRCSRCSGIRIIPAHAGQTPPPTGWKRGEPDHPRACGANALYVIGTVESSGSSPRMRGKRRRDIRVIALRRIIPAHAGQTRSCSCLVRVCADHPRACGANVALSIRAIIGSGSSPRMRGKLASITRKTVSSRIIPAHAGQTSTWIHCITGWTDHPRACGANTAGLDAQIPQYGSSPRMRGKP